MIFEGWVYQVEFYGSEVRIYLKSVDGIRFKINDTFHPWVILVPKNGQMRQLIKEVSSHPDFHSYSVEKKFLSVFEETKGEALKVRTESVKSFRKFVDDISVIPEIGEIAESQLPAFLKYIFEKGIEFLCRCRIETDENLNFKSFSFISDQAPKLVAATIDPKIDGSRIEEIGVRLGDERMKFRDGDERRMLSDFIKTLNDMSYEILITYNGDCFLKLLMKKIGEYNLKRIDAFETSETVYLRGKIHLDIRKDIGRDFAIEDLESPQMDDLAHYYLGGKREEIDEIYEIGMQRLLGISEIAFCCHCKPDLVSRMTGGMLNTFIHFKTAFDSDIIIPDKKRIGENVKTFREFLKMDNAGMIYYPKPGLYNNVAKCDFASMYPNIIVRHNISPETVFCRCCGETCKKRRGLVSRGLKAVLDRRLELKRKMKQSSGLERKIYDTRQRALKALLVCCFGYLGYNAFIFSRVECKELVNKISREIVAKTKEIAEKNRLEVLYEYVDCVFVKGSMDDVKTFCRECSEEFGIELDLDEYFRWVVFCPSKRNKYDSIVNRYFAMTYGNELEARGIAVRRRDFPPILKKMQSYLIFQLFSNLASEDQLVARLGEIDFNSLLRKFLESEHVGDFVIRKFMSRPFFEYSVRTEAVRAFEQMMDKEWTNDIRYCYVKNSADGVAPASQTAISDIDREKYFEKGLDCIREVVGNIFL